MMTTTMRLFHIVVRTLALCWLAQPLAAEAISRDYHETFDVDEGMRLILEHGDGDVEITPWDADTLEVDVRYRAQASNIGWSKNTEFKVDFSQDDKTISVVVHEPKRMSIGVATYRESEYRFRIKAPSYLELQLEGEDGDVTIGDLRGSIRLRLEDGDVEMRNIEAGRTEVTLEDGDQDVSATFELETRDGRIRLMAADVANLQQERKRTTGQVGPGSGSIYVRTVDGSVTLRQ
jgi:hypothetical protein